MTDQELSKMIAVCMHTWPNHRVDNPETLLMAWRMALREVPYAAANVALERILKESTFFPAPGEIYQLVLEMTDALPNASDAWELVQRRMKEVYPGQPAPTWTAPYPVQQTVKGMGGLYQLQMSENPMADRAHFLRMYAENRKRSAREVNIAALIERGAAALEPGFDAVPVPALARTGGEL